MTGSGNTASPEKKTILFVDDESSIRRLGQTILERNGFMVFQAKDGSEALEIFKREKSRIDLVVLDLTMPNRSGEEVLRALRDLDPDVKIIISSGHHTDGSLPLLQDMGADGFVPKPYLPSDLLRTIRSILDRASPSGSPK